MEDLLFGGMKLKGRLLKLTIIFFLVLNCLIQTNSWAKEKRSEKQPQEDFFLEEERKSFAENCEKSSGWCLEWQNNNDEKNREIFFKELLKNYPMEEMAECLAKQDRKVADFLVAIAKKESNWGKYSPQKDKKMCFNYWGYKGQFNQTKSGYSCFDSKEQAISVVGGRIKELLEKGIDTPEKMLIWKCGSTCAGHNPKGVAKWVSDVKSVLLAMNF